jgi:hypothetical protein
LLLQLCFALRSLLRADEVIDPGVQDLASHDGVVTAPVEMEGFDLSRRPRIATPSSVRGRSTQSLRFTPSVVQPMGMPNLSVAIDHFQPVLPRSIDTSERSSSMTRS